MRKDGVFVNAGRGELCDTDALVKALQSGTTFGAALGCTAPEPLAPKAPAAKHGWLADCPLELIF